MQTAMPKTSPVPTPTQEYLLQRLYSLASKASRLGGLPVREALELRHVMAALQAIADGSR